MSEANNIRAAENDILITLRTEHNSYIKLKAKIAYKIEKIIGKFVRKNILPMAETNKIANKTKKHFVKKFNSKSQILIR